MTITVEDGSIVAGANSYATVAELRAYAEARGVDLTAETDVALEAMLIRSMDYIAGKFSALFQGSRVSSAQELHFPRRDVWVDGVMVASDEIPRPLFYGQLAGAIEAKDNDLQANATPGIIRERVEGVVEIEYSNGGKVQAVSAFTKADTLIRQVCRASGLVSIKT